MSAPCLSCPSNCTMCAFDHQTITSDKEVKEVVSASHYGCIKKASIHQNSEGEIFMKVRELLYPLRKTKNKNILEAQKRTRLALVA